MYTVYCAINAMLLLFLRSSFFIQYIFIESENFDMIIILDAKYRYKISEIEINIYRYSDISETSERP